MMFDQFRRQIRQLNSVFLSVFTGAAETDLQHPDLPYVQPHPAAIGLSGGLCVRVSSSSHLRMCQWGCLTFCVPLQSVAK